MHNLVINIYIFFIIILSLFINKCVSSTTSIHNLISYIDIKVPIYEQIAIKVFSINSKFLLCLSFKINLVDINILFCMSPLCI